MILHLWCPKTDEIVKVNALPDSGASDFILDKSLSDRMYLRGTDCRCTVVGHTGHETTHPALCRQELWPLTLKWGANTLWIILPMMGHARACIQKIGPS